MSLFHSYKTSRSLLSITEMASTTFLLFPPLKMFIFLYLFFLSFIKSKFYFVYFSVLVPFQLF
eukprot:GAHX01002352.1.p1 GENE.GAHX01002352.1~~GAHX01002352.1.p1  ORF type:complete len:63 (+),score=0.70 GAHX01002352.1:261-449(+)